MSTTRRQVLAVGVLAGGGLLLGVPLAAKEAAKTTAETVALNPFISIARDGTITVYSKHSEMGQGVLTSIAQTVMEELDGDWSKVKAVPGDAKPEYKHNLFGVQATGGSTTTHSSFEQMRQAGAAARAMLLAAAADAWGEPVERLRTEQSVVIGPKAGQRLSYGELAEAAARQPVPDKVVLKRNDQFKLIGKGKARLDGPDKVTGRASYGIDVRMPGLLTALIARPPVFGARPKVVDKSGAKAVYGVRHVVEVDAGIAVVGENFWAARQGLDALKIEWDLGEHAAFSSEGQRRDFDALLAGEGAEAKLTGEPLAVLEKADEARRIEAAFDFPYLAHATMEPMNATAHVHADGVTVWAPTQFQTIDQAAAAEVAGVAPEQVVLHTTLLGGGFGRRANPKADFVREAVAVSKAVSSPVKVIWLREHDLQGGYYRPRTRVDARLALDEQQRPAALEVKIASQSIMAGTLFGAQVEKTGIDPSQVEGLADWAYATPHLRVSYHRATGPVPVLWWRSVGHTFSAFVKETLIDEAAERAGADPIDYRIELLAAHPRQIAVLKTVRRAARWGKAPEGHAQGVAVHESFGSIVAQIVELSLLDGRIKVHKITAAIDCGAVVNPALVKAQIMGGALMGLSAALGEAITYKDGRAEQSNFHNYPILRLPDAPDVDVHIIDSSAPMGGAGEPGTPPIAAALANALAKATGKRIRELPLKV
jgi:isoquinoline 1-oxidoreductase beta subunit